MARPERPLRPRTPLLTAVAAVVLTACSGAGAEHSDALEATGLTLYLPEVAGRLPVGGPDDPGPGVQDMDPSPGSDEVVYADARPSAVEVADGTVTVTYRSDGRPAYELTEQPAPRSRLCRAVQQIADSSCTEAGGVLRSTMEEMAVVGVVRGGTLLVLRGLVVEAAPGVVDAAVEILQDAPELSAGTLADVGS